MASSTAAAVPVHGEAGLYDVEAPLQHQQHQHEQLPPPLDNNLGEEATSEEDRAADQQSYPLGQSHTPLTSIPTLGQALIEGTNIDRKYVHSFLQVLADHSQFSDKYQHYEEDEYERKRKRKLRESERKMFFYAGQGGSLSGEAKSSKRRASAAASSTAASSTSDLKNSASKKRRRRDQDRDRVLDKDTRRQMLGGSTPAVLAAFSAAGNLPAAAAAAMSHAADLVLDVDHSPASSSSSPAQTPPSGYGYVDQRAASMPNMLAAGSWDSFGHLHQHQQQPVQHHHQPQQQFYPQQHFGHQAAGHAMLRQTRVPQQSYQPLQRFHGSSSASLDYMPQMSPASSLSSSLPSSSSSYQLSSCYSSPSQSPQQPAADGVYAPAFQVHQQQLAGHYAQAQAHYAPQRPARMAVSLPAEMLSAAYHQHQVHPQHHQHQHHHGYHQTSEAMSGLMMGGGGGGASLDADGDEAWMSSSSSSLSADACPSAAGGELPAAGSESFSSFGPYVDPATGGLVVGDAATAAGHDGGMLACADMSAAAAAAAAAVEHFMHSNLHHQQPQQQHEESSPEGQQLQAGAGMDEDWLNSFFSDDCSPTLLGGVAVAPGSNGDNAAACGLDSLFADMENFYGRLVN